MAEHVSTWYSSRVSSITRLQADENEVNRYKRFTQLAVGGGSKVQFVRKDMMKIEGPYEAFYVTAKYEYRPDLLAFELYGSSLYAWSILAVNHFKTIYDIVAGTYIYVPKIAQVLEVN